MTARKPNNMPWIILGGIFGVGFLGLFGFGIYMGAKSVSDEMSITLPEPPEMAAHSDINNVITIFVDETDSISFDGETVDDIAALKDVLDSLDTNSLKSTAFILRISEESSHKRLITIKDMLDAFEAKSIIEVIRSDVE